MPMTESQKERNKATIEYRSCYALMSGKDTLLYIGDLTSDWTRTPLSPNDESKVERRETFGGAWHNKYWLVPSCLGRIVTYNPDYRADSVLKIVNDTLPNLVKQQQQMLADKSKTLERTLSELRYYMRVHGVNDEGYHVVAAHYVEVAADKERIDTALTALQNIGEQERQDAPPQLPSAEERKPYPAVHHTDAQQTETYQRIRHLLKRPRPIHRSRAAALIHL